MVHSSSFGCYVSYGPPYLSLVSSIWRIYLKFLFLPRARTHAHIKSCIPPYWRYVHVICTINLILDKIWTRVRVPYACQGHVYVQVWHISLTTTVSETTIYISFVYPPIEWRVLINYFGSKIHLSGVTIVSSSPGSTIFDWIQQLASDSYICSYHSSIMHTMWSLRAWEHTLSLMHALSIYR